MAEDEDLETRILDVNTHIFTNLPQKCRQFIPPTHIHPPHLPQKNMTLPVSIGPFFERNVAWTLRSSFRCSVKVCPRVGNPFPRSVGSTNLIESSELGIFLRDEGAVLIFCVVRFSPKLSRKMTGFFKMYAGFYKGGMKL